MANINMDSSIGAAISIDQVVNAFNKVMDTVDGHSAKPIAAGVFAGAAIAIIAAKAGAKIAIAAIKVNAEIASQK